MICLRLHIVIIFVISTFAKSILTIIQIICDILNSYLGNVLYLELEFEGISSVSTGMWIRNTGRQHWHLKTSVKIASDYYIKVNEISFKKLFVALE